MTINGVLAKQYLDVSLPLQVLQSNAGFYLGTADDDGPCSRESVEFWGFGCSGTENRVRYLSLIIE